MSTQISLSSPIETRTTPTVAELFTAFLALGLIGFGGVLPLARRMVVEQRRWLNPAEFTDLLGLCQFLPGGNIIKLYTINAKGNVLPYSPALSFNISADYKMSTPIGPVTFDVTDSYTSHFYAESDNVLRQKAAHLLNTSLTWESANGHFGASLFMNNILNKAIASQFGSLVTGYEADYPQPPRTYGFRLRYSY